MQLRKLVTDDSAVSPVIGVILMVAVTVILAAVIGAFVLNLGTTTATAPTATWDMTVDDGSNDGFDEVYPTDGETISIMHKGGDSVDSSALTVTVGGETVSASSSNVTWKQSPPDSWSAGETAVVEEVNNDNNGIASGDTVTLVWESPEGGKTQVLFSESV